MDEAAAIQSLVRGLSVIKVFTEDAPVLTLSDAAKAAGLSRATTRRILLTLHELGYVRMEGRLFSLRPRVLELGYSFLSSMGLPNIAQQHMESLVGQVNESCSLSVLDGTDIIYVVRVPTRRIMSVSINIGTRFPAYATSMGRVLMASRSRQWVDDYLRSTPLVKLTPSTLDDPDQLRTVLQGVREQGYCMVEQELELGLRSIAVPIHDSAGTVVAAMNVSVHTGSGSPEATRRSLLPLLQATAEAIDADLRSNRFHSTLVF